MIEFFKWEALVFINLVFNAVLIPEFGVYGACYATILSLGCQFVFTQFLVWNTVKLHLTELKYAEQN